MLRITNGTYRIKCINRILTLIVISIIIFFSGCEFNKSLPNKFKIFDYKLIGVWKTLDSNKSNITITYTKDRKYLINSNDYNNKLKGILFKCNNIKILQLDFKINNKLIKNRYTLLKLDYLSKEKISFTYLNLMKFKKIIKNYSEKNNVENINITSELLYRLIIENKNILFKNTKKIILIKKGKI